MPIADRRSFSFMSRKPSELFPLLPVLPNSWTTTVKLRIQPTLKMLLTCGLCVPTSQDSAATNAWNSCPRKWESVFFFVSVSYHFQNKVLRFLHLTAVLASLSATGHHSWNPYKQKIACSLPVVFHVSSHGRPNFLFEFDLDLEHPPELPLFFMDVWFYVGLDVASIYWALNE